MKKIFTLSLFLFSLSSFSNLHLDKVLDEYNGVLSKKYLALPHKDNFILPFSYIERPNTKTYEGIISEEKYRQRGDYYKKREAEFQFSFMLLMDKDFSSSGFNLFVAYTHHSWWQVYNGNWSRQFRETNYAPEVFLRKLLNNPINILGGKFIAYDIGFIHESNGQTQELSRSWNRLYLRSASLFDRTLIRTSLWTRINTAANLDDNPDISKYLGHGEIKVDQLFLKSRIHMKVIPGTRYFGGEIGYSYPLHNGLRAYIKYGRGYGLSLIDYNFHSNRVGIGIILSDIFSFGVDK